MSNRRLPLWLALSLPCALVLVSVFGVLLVSQQRTVNRLIDEDSANLLSISNEHVQTRLQQYLDIPFHMQTAVSDALVRQALYTPGNLGKVEDYLSGVFNDVYQQEFHQLSMLQLGTEQGEFVAVGRQRDASVHITLKDQRTDNKLVEYLSDRRTPKLTVERYDPRARPWYKPVAESRLPRWSSLYVSSTDSEFVVISATAPVMNSNGTLLGVISTDVSLNALSSFLRQTPLSSKYKSAVLYIVDDKGQLVAQSNGAAMVTPAQSGQAQSILTAAQSPIEQVRVSFTQLPQIASTSKSTTFQLMANREPYFARVTPFVDKRGLNWRVVSMVSMEDLSGNARSNANNSLLLALALALIGSIAVLWVIKRIALPIQETANAATQIANASESGFIPMRESRIRETSMLTTAFNAMSQRIQAQLSKLHDLAMNDTATGLLNRQGLLSEAQWTEPREVLLILLALDNFKMVNTSLGTVTGDDLLRKMARRMRERCPASCLLARVSGTEFIVLLPHVTQPTQCNEVLQSVQSVFSTPFETATDEVVLRASMGVVTTRAMGNAVENDLLRQANIALRAARERGQSQVVHFEPALLNQTVANAQMLADLKVALAQSELRVHFQPIVSLTTEKIHGMEALVRWQSPTRGMVGPVHFIPMAEESGLIVELGNWVLQRATTEVAQLMLKETLPSNFSLHVNVSVRQLVQTDFAAKVAQALAKSQLPAKMLMLEVTESLMMDDDSSTMKTIANIRAMGVGIALDDFGTGYSSLSYLNRFRFHAIKIDRSFVVAAEKTKSSETILKAVVDITHGLGVEAVAEGIETREQARMLRDFGCAYAQGYLFGKPAPLEDAWTAIQAANTPDPAASPLESAPATHDSLIRT